VDRAGWLTYAVLGGTAFVFVVPFYYMIVAASRPMWEMNQSPPPILPGPLLWSNIVKAVQQQSIGLALGNSFIVAGTITLATVLLCTLAGFAFAKMRFRGKNVLFAIALGTMMVPPSLGVVPLYALMAWLGLAGTLNSVILPTLVQVFGVFFMRQYLVEALPDELLEAARIDGATSLRTFWSIVLPIARPGMAVLGMLTFMTAWNDFFWPVIALNSTNPTIQVALNNLGRLRAGHLGDHGRDAGRDAAGDRGVRAAGPPDRGRDHRRSGEGLGGTRRHLSYPPLAVCRVGAHPTDIS